MEEEKGEKFVYKYLRFAIITLMRLQEVFQVVTPAKPLPARRKRHLRQAGSGSPEVFEFPGFPSPRE
jgi:hypothetical protein